MATERQAEYIADLALIAREEAKRLEFDAESFRSDTDSNLLDSRKIMRGMSASTASQLINGITVNYLQKHWTWRPTSKQSVVAEFAYQYAKSMNKERISRHDYDGIYRYVRRTLGLRLQDQFRPLVFTKNENGSRVPVDMETAEEQFRRLISAVKIFVNKRLVDDRNQNNGEQQQEQIDEIDDDEIDELDEQEENEQGSGQIEIHEEDDDDFPRDATDLLRRIKNVANFAADRNVDGGVAMDAIGMRTFVDGAKAYTLGIPVDWIVSDIMQHWQPEAIRTIWNFPGDYIQQHQQNREAWEYDPQTFKPNVAVPGIEFVNARHHANLPYLLTKMHGRLPTLCWGGSGTGKTTAYKHAAECLRQALGYSIEEEDKFPFGFLSMTRGTAPSAFNGRPMITNTAIMIEFMHAQAKQDMDEMNRIAKEAKERGDVVISIWERLYGGGGVMLLDEIDAGDENLILLVNAAIANDHFANTATGKLIEKHPDFIIGFAGNTNGMGANKLHGARNRLDHATLDRVRVGRIKFDLDMRLAENTFRDIVSAGR